MTIPAQQGHETDRHCPALHAQPRKKFLLFDPHAHALLQKNLFRTQLQIFSLHDSIWLHGIKAGWISQRWMLANHLGL